MYDEEFCATQNLACSEFIPHNLSLFLFKIFYALGTKQSVSSLLWSPDTLVAFDSHGSAHIAARQWKETAREQS